MSRRYAATFLALACGALVVAWASGPLAVRAVAACAAVAFGLVGAAYGGGGPGWLLKHRGGRRRPWAWPLYWPYFLMSELGLGLFRIGERGPPFVEVAPNLYLGRRLMAREARRGGSPVWCAVLDLAAEFAEVGPLREVAGYRSLPVLDATAPSPGDLVDAVDWLAARASEGPTYVHCALGHGRSATVVIGYLLATGRAATVEEALALVRSRRPGVGLRAPQLAALEGFSRRIAARRG